LSKFGIEFLLLALRIDKHIKGYVDFYFGPEKLRKIVDNDPITSPSKLLTDCKALQKDLFKQGYDKKRDRYLEKLLTAMRTSIEILNGIEIPIKEQMQKQYDVALIPVKESELGNLKEEVNEAYEGSGSLEERMRKLRVRRRVPENKILPLFKKALNIVEERTKELFIDLLPKKESIILKLIDSTNSDKINWSAYEWYLGNFLSRIELNPKNGIYWTSLLSTAAHEGYPGHHTTFIMDEKRYHELNQFEHSILLIHSPKLLICEGIADLAENALFNYQESAEIGLREFCPDSLKEIPIEQMIKQSKIRSKISLFWYNFGYHALIDEWEEKELIRYATNFEIFSGANIKNQLKIITNPVYEKTIFSYSLGSRLIINKCGEFPSASDFRKLLSSPILPSDLAKNY